MHQQTPSALLEKFLADAEKARNSYLIEQNKGQLRGHERVDVWEGDLVADKDGGFHIERSSAGEIVHQAQIYRMAIHNILGETRSLGIALVKAIWNAYSMGLIAMMGDEGQEYNPDDLKEWAAHELVAKYDTEADRINRAVNLITDIIKPVYDAHQAGKPFVLDSGEVVTVDSLIGDEVRVYGNLTTISFAFKQATEKENPEDQKSLLDAALNGGREESKATRDKVLGRDKPKFSYRVVMKRPGKYDIIVSEADDATLSLYQKLVSGVGEEII